ncbi:C-terminal processing peptidase [Desulfomonile tiedjei DSM 6799]|uniref:C-terminal processing peptidase n=2 Tax=Desulfomonile tiedjei TaxID=2358 RepID=I4C8H4_DESTA|nr:C-terminal processing peptidase [Desulfomonile tiedjei DSM 6799]
MLILTSGKVILPLLFLMFFIYGSAVTGFAATNGTEFSDSGFIRPLRSVTGIRPFDEAIALFRQHYAQKIHDADLFNGILEKFTFSMLPNCTEDLETFQECGAEPEVCFSKAIAQIESACKINREQSLLRSLNLFLQDLDPNSCLMDLSMLKELKIGTSGKFGGVGMVVTPKNGEYVVISPFEGSPAYDAGIRAGDTILQIDQNSLQNVPLLEVLRKVRGPAGSTISVTLKEARSGRIRQLVMKRRMIQIRPVRFALLSQDAAYLRIVNFQESVSGEVYQALVRFSRMPSRDKLLILDLRDNPGGVFEEAIQVADLFVPDGMITSLKGRNPDFAREFRASGKKMVPDTKIIILINQGSASASEILTGALQGRTNVIVAGKPSFGKASVQAVFPIQTGMALRLTTAHYYTADGRDIEGKGLQPDILIEEDSHWPERTAVDVLRADQLERDPWIRKILEYHAANNRPGVSPFTTMY